MATTETSSMTMQRNIQVISQQSEDNFDENEISSTIGTLEAGLRDVANEVQGLHRDMDNIGTEIEDLKKRMHECYKRADNTTK